MWARAIGSRCRPSTCASALAGTPNSSWKTACGPFRWPYANNWTDTTMHKTLLLTALAAWMLLTATPAWAAGGTLKVRLNADIRTTDPGVNRDANTDVVVAHL